MTERGTAAATTASGGPGVPETRDRLLEAAIEAFSELGYQGASVRAITERAGTSYGTFYVYFSGKEEVFAAVLARVQARLTERGRSFPADGPLGRLTPIVRSLVCGYEDYPGVARALSEGMTVSAEVHDLWSGIRSRGVRTIKRHVDAEAEGRPVRDLDMRHVATALASMQEWFPFNVYVLETMGTPGPNTADRVVDTISELFSHVIYDTGLSAPMGEGLQLKRISKVDPGASLGRGATAVAEELKDLDYRSQQSAMTREKVLTAAIEVFSEEGYLATTAAAIAERAGTSHGTFYVYFRNRDDVFAQVITRLFETILAAARPVEVGDTYASLASQIAGFLRHFVLYPGIMQALFEGINQSPTIRALWRDIHKFNVDSIRDRLEADAKRNLVRRKLDVEATAEALGCMAEWYALTELALDAGSGRRRSTTFPVAVRTLTDVCFAAAYALE